MDTEFNGVNLSLFIEAEQRRRGLGKELALRLIEDFMMAESKFDEWKDRTLWTGVRASNTASVRMVGSLGFERVGSLSRAPEYDVYTY